MPFRIIRNDITKVAADAIVNTANPNPVYGSGTDQAVYEAAGARQLLKERRKIGKIRPGEAAATQAFALKARYIIHTVGPVWKGGTEGEFETLASCYRKSLHLAKILNCESIAFPLISTGVYGFPKDKALSIALSEFGSFLEDEEMDITLAVYDRKALELSSELVESVEQYIDEKYVEEHQAKARQRMAERRVTGALAARDSRDSGPLERRERRARETFADHINEAYMQNEPAGQTGGFLYEEEGTALPFPEEAPKVKASRGTPRSLQDVIKNVGETFQEMLLRMIDERGLTDPEVYKGANLDRKLFSKIRCNAAYKPSKKTVLALAVALKLNLDETVDLLARAGFALSPSSKADLIVEFCIANQIYNVLEINTILFKYGEATLS